MQNNTDKMQKKQTVIKIHLGIVNAYLIQGARSILVDTGYPKDAPVILKKLSEHGVDTKEISLILITHGHMDHFGSTVELKKHIDAPVAIHSLDAESARKGFNSSIHPTGMTGRLLSPFLAKKGMAKFKPFEPDILIKDTMNLEKYGVKGKVISTPGHTPGSISIVLSSGKIIVGDLIMGGIIRKSHPSYPPFADDIAQIRKNIEQVMHLSPTQIFSGHGGPFDPESILLRFF